MSADAKPKSVQVDGESVPKETADDIVLPPYLRTLLETIATREGFADGYNIISRPGSNVGDGFQGIMLSVVISGARNGTDKDDLVLVCKIPPLSEMRQQFTLAPFKQEIAAYETLLPALVEFQREKGISEADGFFAFPKCYGTYAEEEKYHFAIVLEDLRHSGFRMWNKYLPIDFKHVQLALSELGKFHALSFALRQQRPQVFAQFQTLGSSFYSLLNKNPDISVVHEKTFSRVFDALQPEDKEEIRKVTHLRNHFMANFRAAASAEEFEPFTVFCHGDFWNNNMMFQYSNADSLEPQRAVLIDWQLGQYCSPVTDITYYLYSSTEQALRTAHFDDILRVYHDNLAKLLRRLGGNADTQFSYDDLQSQLRTAGIYGLIMAPFLIQVFTVKAEDLPNFDEITADDMKNFDLMANANMDVYNLRVRDVIRDFVGRGFFTEKHLAIRDTTQN